MIVKFYKLQVSVRKVCSSNISGIAIRDKDWALLQEELARLDFHPNPAGHTICNYLYLGIPVDIMMTHTTAFGPANRWYKIGFEQ